MKILKYQLWYDWRKGSVNESSLDFDRLHAVREFNARLGGNATQQYLKTGSVWKIYIQQNRSEASLNYSILCTKAMALTKLLEQGMDIISK